MRVSKKGDLLTLKMMVKEGADVNEQDANGESSKGKLPIGNLETHCFACILCPAYCH